MRQVSGGLNIPDLPPDAFGECQESEDMTDDEAPGYFDWCGFKQS